MAADTAFVQECFDEGRAVPAGRWEVDAALRFPEGIVRFEKGCVLVTNEQLLLGPGAKMGGEGASIVAGDDFRFDDGSCL